MPTKSFLNNLSGALIILAFVPLIISVVWKGYKPPKSSWIIWAVVDTVIAVGMYQKHALNMQLIGTLLGVWIAVAVLLKYGESGWSRWQITQLVIAAIGVGLWQIFGESNIGIATGCGLLFLGAVDSWKDAWQNPEGQKNIWGRASWTLFWVSCPPAVLAVSQHSFAGYAQPITFLAIESVMMFLILFAQPIQQMMGQARLEDFG
ncbi:hypothetical protein KW800_02260 [Candidatus Parcubacteria bacterium]|nr:hypothetical protein [Candidatus Parcubacteria bacterium]